MSGAPRESAITNTILRLLRARGAYATKNHGGSYARAGTPDITACYLGRCILIEVKTATGRLTPLQTLELAKARQAGAEAIVARSWSDVEAVLDQVQLESWPTMSVTPRGEWVPSRRGLALPNASVLGEMGTVRRQRDDYSAEHRRRTKGDT